MNTTTIEHKYNIGDRHFDFDDEIGVKKIKEFQITKININSNKFIKYIINRIPENMFANETELNEEEICPTIEDWIDKKTSDYKKQLIEGNLTVLNN